VLKEPTMSEMRFLRAVSYGMIGVLAGGLAVTVIGAANALMNM